MKIVNLTPHDINIVDDSGNILKTYPKSGCVARIDEKPYDRPDIDGVTCFTTVNQGLFHIGDTSVLDEADYFIVSGQVFEKVDDVKYIQPDTFGNAVRNDKGHIIGVKAFKVK